jgi:hypothetical protein
MTFHDELHRVIDTLGDHVRHAAAGHFQASMAALSRAMQAETAAAVAQASDALEREHAARLAEVQARLDEVQGRLDEVQRSEASPPDAGAAPDGRKDGQDNRREHAVSADDLHAAWGRLLDGLRAIDGASLLSDLLDALAVAVHGEASAAAVLLADGDSLRSWRLLGFDDRLDHADRFEVPLGDRGLLAVAARTGRAAVASGGDPDAAPVFSVAAAGDELIAGPLSLAGRIVAIVYAERRSEPSADRPDAAWRKALEVFARQAARANEALTVLRSRTPQETDPAEAGANGKSDRPADAGRHNGDYNRADAHILM